MQSNVEVAADHFCLLQCVQPHFPKQPLTSAHNAFVSSVPQVLSLESGGGNCLSFRCSGEGLKERLPLLLPYPRRGFCFVLTCIQVCLAFPLNGASLVSLLPLWQEQCHFARAFKESSGAFICCMKTTYFLKLLLDELGDKYLVLQTNIANASK